MKRSRRITLAAAILVLLIPAAASAQGTYSVTGYSLMGGRGTLLTDIDAALVNPALLGMPGRSSFSLRLFSVSGHVDQSFTSRGLWNRLQGKLLTDQDKQDILDGMGPAASVNGLFEAAGPGVQVGRFALGTYMSVDAEALFPKDFVELALYGNQFDRDYRFGDIGLVSDVVSILHASYAFPMPFLQDAVRALPVPVRGVWGGVTLKYYQGHAHSEIEGGETFLRFTPDGLVGSADYRFRTAGIPGGLVDEENDDPAIAADTTFAASSGRGIGLDLGLTAALTPDVTVHAALVNLSPGITWDNSTYEVQVTATADTISLGTFLELDEEADSTDLDSLTSHEVDVRKVGSFRSSVPLILRLGGTYRYGRLALNAEFEQALTRGMGYNLVPRLGLGVEFRPVGLLPLRAGLSLGGKLGVGAAIGIGLDLKAFVWDVAVGNTGLTPGGVKGLGAATGLKISF
ncbi:MAG: DUF5723 family protein [bacterium]